MILERADEPLLRWPATLSIGQTRPSRTHKHSVGMSSTKEGSL